LIGLHLVTSHTPNRPISGIHGRYQDVVSDYLTMLDGAINHSQPERRVRPLPTSSSVLGRN